MSQPPPAARQAPPAPARRRILLHLLASGVLVYALSLGAFALLHYEGGKRPSAGRIVLDFHAFLGLGPAPARAAPPPPVVVAPPPPPPPPPPRRPAPPPPVVREPSPLDRIAATVGRVRREAPGLKRRDRDSSFEAARIDLISQLGDARDELGTILDENPDDVRANELWDSLQELLAALRKL